MSISDKLIQLNTIKTDIKDAIETKGVTVGSAPFADYAGKIGDISGGGGGGVQYKDGFTPQLLFVVDGGMNSGEVMVSLATCKITLKNITDDTTQVIEVPLKTQDDYDSGPGEQTHGRGLVLVDLTAGKEYRIEKIESTFNDRDGQSWVSQDYLHVCGLGSVMVYQTPPTEVLCNFFTGSVLSEPDKELTKFTARWPAYTYDFSTYNYLFRISVWPDDD